MKIIFFGNSKYSTIVARAIHKKFGLTAIVTIPDRIVGRKKILTPSPVKKFADEHNIPVIATDSLSKSVLADLGVEPLIADADFFVVADYGLIVPNYLLAIPKHAPLNVHHSLLPKYRGPSPAPTAILNGDKVSGVTIIQMTDKVDAGPILAQKEYALKPDETTDSLLIALNTLGGELVIEVIENYQSIKPVPQDESKASLTKHMFKQDGYIDLDNPPSPEQLDRMIRAYFPWPNVWTRVVLRSHLVQGETLEKERVISDLPKTLAFMPGMKASKSETNRKGDRYSHTITDGFSTSDDKRSLLPSEENKKNTPRFSAGMFIKFLPRKASPYEANVQDRILIQVEGGKPMSFKDFLNGYPGMKGEIAKLFSMSS